MTYLIGLAVYVLISLGHGLYYKRNGMQDAWPFGFLWPWLYLDMLGWKRAGIFLLGGLVIAVFTLVYFHVTLRDWL